MTTRYSDDEVKEILRRALERQQVGADGIDHEDLVAAAKEVGIDPAALERAAAETRLDREARDAVVAERSKKRRRWAKGLGTFAVVNAFLFIVDLMTAGGPWFMWPLVGWGLFVVLEGLKVLPPPSRAAEEELVEREKTRIVRRREKERARRAKESERASRKSVETAFENAVEEGVTALLSAIASQIEKAARAAESASRPPHETDFDRYVQRKKGGAPAEPSKSAATATPIITPAPPRTRVADDDAEAEVEVEPDASRRSRRSRR
jgi:hypothetical protein